MQQPPTGIGEIRTLDEAHFHLGNSGIYVRIVEDFSEQERADLTRVRIHEYYVELSMRAFQTKLSLRVPLETADFAYWLGHALVRTSKRMRRVAYEGEVKFTTMEAPKIEHSSGENESG